MLKILFTEVSRYPLPLRIPVYAAALDLYLLFLFAPPIINEFFPQLSRSFFVWQSWVGTTLGFGFVVLIAAVEYLIRQRDIEDAELKAQYLALVIVTPLLASLAAPLRHFSHITKGQIIGRCHLGVDSLGDRQIDVASGEIRTLISPIMESVRRVPLSEFKRLPADLAIELSGTIAEISNEMSALEAKLPREDNAKMTVIFMERLSQRARELTTWLDEDLKSLRARRFHLSVTQHLSGTDSGFEDQLR